MKQRMVIEVEYEPDLDATEIEWSVRDAAFHVPGVLRVMQMTYNGDGGFDPDPSTLITNIEDCTWCRGSGSIVGSPFKPSSIVGACAACKGVGYRTLTTPRDAAKSDTV